MRRQCASSKSLYLYKCINTSDGPNHLAPYVSIEAIIPFSRQSCRSSFPIILAFRLHSILVESVFTFILLVQHVTQEMFWQPPINFSSFVTAIKVTYAEFMCSSYWVSRDNRTFIKTIGHLLPQTHGSNRKLVFDFANGQFLRNRTTCIIHHTLY